jgi:hypothetical protein
MSSSWIGWPLRIAGAALLGATAGIHLHLYTTGYQHIPTIGKLFLLNGIAASVLCLAVVFAPKGISLAGAAFAGLGLEIGTGAGLIYTTHHTLFGFRDSFQAPYAKTSLYVEIAGAVVLAVLTLLALNQRRAARV